MVNSENENTETDTKWGSAYQEEPPAPDLSSTLDYDFEFIYMIILVTIGIIAGIVGVILFAIRRKTN